MAAASPQNVTIVDAGQGVGPWLATLLAERGLAVTGWSPGADAPPPDSPPAVGWVHAADVRSLGIDRIAATDTVIFNLPALDEAGLLTGGGLADAVAADGAFFLETLQVFSRAMIENGRGQIWVLGLDDSFAYYMPVPIAPVAQHTRIGAVRALAKECGRFGVSANAAVLQPAPETTDPAAWQAARAGLASYAQRFKPVPLAAVADTLAFWLTCERLPMNGSVLHFGNGVYDGNI